MGAVRSAGDDGTGPRAARGLALVGAAGAGAERSSAGLVRSGAAERTANLVRAGARGLGCRHGSRAAALGGLRERALVAVAGAQTAGGGQGARAARCLARSLRAGAGGSHAGQ